MNKIAIVSLSALGGTALFAVSFLGFAKLNGVPLHSLPAIGGMFPPDPEAEKHADDPSVPPAAAGGNTTKEHAGATKEPADAGHPAPAPGASKHEPAPTPVPAATGTRPRETHAGIFSVLDTDGLYTQDELRALADSLRAKNRETEQRAAELDRREDLLTDRLTALDERRRTMDEFAKQLDARERELKAREAEASRDSKSGGAQDGKKLPAGDLSIFFGDGEAEVLVARLAGFTPAEVAMILVKLPPTRAKELLDALPSTRWRECAEAYARAAQTPPP